MHRLNFSIQINPNKGHLFFKKDNTECTNVSIIERFYSMTHPVKCTSTDRAVSEPQGYSDTKDSVNRADDQKQYVEVCL